MCYRTSNHQEGMVSMLANFEKRAYNGTERVWTGRYRNLHNLPHWHLENELICVEQGQVTVSQIGRAHV